MPASISKGMLSPIGPLSKLAAGIRANTDLGKGGAALGRGPNLQSKLTAAPWAGTWPAPGATLDLDFANDRGFIRGIGQRKSLNGVTFTRASNAQYIDSTGTLQTAANNVARFDWANTTQLPQNLLTYTQQLDNSAWGKTRASISANVAIAPDGTLTADKLVEDTSVGNSHSAAQLTVLTPVSTTITASVYAKAAGRNFVVVRLFDNAANVNGTSNNYDVAVNLTDGSTGTQVLTGNPINPSFTVTDAGSGWWRIALTFTKKSDATRTDLNIFPALNKNATTDSYFYTGDGTSGIYIWGAQIEQGSTATNYKEVQANVTSNTPLQASPTCNGLLIEESRTNRALWCRDATQSSWVNTNITPVLNQTGIDGVANSASSLTASAANGTTIQTVTLALGARASSIYLKRLTGTGAVQVTMDGTTWTTIDLSNGIWNRIALSSAVTNPVIGVQIVTSGDAVAMDFAQIEDGSNVTTPILTTSATVTRAADNASLLGVNFTSWYNYGSGSIFSEGFLPSGAGTFCNICDSGTPGSIERMQLRANVINYQFVYSSAGSASIVTFGTYISAISLKAAATYNHGELTGCVNATSVSSLNTAKNTVPVEMRIGRLGSTEYANGTIKRIVYFPTKLNESTLKVLTGQSA